ncbi:flagellar basal body rod protein FlgF [Thermomonas hydrothermalis]|uniref:Flagellar basal-body rod protein FlgF n=1 Tax=Thermomonas hydrothermalis TaxID=213588 RepID=A0A1M5A6Z6_9GAMM|nr:flagellar basal body rod protein FlgF [Thermomonas hydrothermalis]MCL6618483.1 flagellar basal body rod protein FlgF [Thermomonas hydrothermalis]SHF25934.1 flagellar basal-body rod protein FlgF [Thermomonas hydrothermalis]
MTDRAIYVAMTGASAMLRQQATVAHNLANVDSTGFQASLDATVAAPVTGPGLPTRVATTARTLGVDARAGAIRNTGNPLDVALKPERWLAVQDATGGVAYTRAGDLTVNANGMLVTARGQPVLGADGAPLTIPAYQAIEIGQDGTISIVPQGQPASTMTEAGRLQIVAAKTTELQRGDDGLMRPPPGAAAPPAATGAALISGALESSNVDVAGALVSMITLSRQFDMQVQLLRREDENFRATNSIVR